MEKISLISRVTELRRLVEAGPAVHAPSCDHVTKTVEPPERIAIVTRCSVVIIEDGYVIAYGCACYSCITASSVVEFSIFVPPGGLEDYMHPANTRDVCCRNA